MVHVYQVTSPRKRRYIAQLQSLTDETLLAICQPYFARGMSYYAQEFSVFEAQYNTKVFGITWPYENVEEGYCQLCNERAEFKRTSLMCVVCDKLIGGI